MSANNVAEKFQAVAPRRLTAEIAYQIEHLILSRELNEGDRLPPERELAERLKVSRNILREAISMLAQKGLLEVRPGSGTYVCPPNAESLRDALDLLLRFQESALLDVMEARLGLEVEIAGLAAERAKEEHLKAIADDLAEMEASLDSPEAYIEADVQFHRDLVHAAGNEILQLLIDCIRGALRQNIRVAIASDESAMKDSIRWHRSIMRSVKAGDAKKARDAMRNHLMSVSNSLRKV